MIYEISCNIGLVCSLLRRWILCRGQRNMHTDNWEHMCPNFHCGQ